MAIENHGVIYRIGLSPDIIKEIAHSLLLTGKTELAMSILSNSMYNEENAGKLIESMLETIKNQAQAAMTSATQQGNMASSSIKQP